MSTDFSNSSLSNSIEGVGPSFVKKKLLEARGKTLKVLSEIRERIQIGMTEDEARKMALDIFKSHGVTKHWHRPYIRFGSGTALSFHDPLQESYRLQENDPYSIDLGPVWVDSETGIEYEGDYGDTFVFGNHPRAEACARAARQLFVETSEAWKVRGLTGEELYCFLKDRAENLGYLLHEKVDGHRLSDFPHHIYSKERLAKVGMTPTSMLWVLEIQITDPDKTFGAFFEDLLC
jgi:CDP-4-dehydro-6-deoxyglucose reductase